MSTDFAPDPRKLEALAEFAAGAGHEINNPLATIIGRAQQLLRDESDPQRRYSLSIIAAQAYRVRDMIGDVMTFARPPQPVVQHVDLSAWISEVLQQAATSASALNCEIHSEITPDITADIDPAQLAIVLHELIRNACQALQPDGGGIQVAAESDDETDAITLTVSDEGRGFSDIEREHAFDPFFSGRQAGRGLGFGLCKAWQIVRMHRGMIAISSAPGGPTHITVTLPRSGYDESGDPAEDA
ncbi:hypothetical protein GC163_03765 [bacterium]|nr:hypothetical protein [bacterium]